MNAKKAEKIAKALSDPNRLLILKEIKKQQQDFLYCTKINEMVNLSQPSVCHHIKQLTDTELITPEKEGRNLKYRLNEKVLNEFIDFLETLKKD